MPANWNLGRQWTFVILIQDCSAKTGFMKMERIRSELFYQHALNIRVCIVINDVP